MWDDLINRHCQAKEQGELMSKYNKLWEYIQKQNEEECRLSFQRIEEIAGTALDHSFLTFKKELPAYGYHVEKISMKEKTVLFYKNK